ncbi:MAG: LUD domain-containing protein [Veillonellaceae bacterium]|nr:LUD domain-containing protein [Veillonellaceae bacterium]
MKKVCENWKQSFPAGKFGEQYFSEFEARGKAASAEIFRVKTAAEGKQIIAELAETTGAKKIVAVDGPLQDASGIIDELKNMGLEVYTSTTDIAEHVDTADIGISAVEFGIAETGSVCMDGYAIEHRLVSMLPPLHIVFMNSSYIVPGVNEALEVLSKVFNRGYISFITGPSRTADIERVLSIGVHGPCRFVIIAVDEEIN